MEAVEVPNVEESARRVLHAVEDIPPWTPLTSSPVLRDAIEKAFRHIESLEDEIAIRREDIKAAKLGLTNKGLSKKGLDIALARRKLLEKEDLARIDETLMVICGIGSLGIQGELFADRGGPVFPGGSDEGGNGAA